MADDPESFVDSVLRGDRANAERLLGAQRPYLRRVVDVRMDEVLRVRVDPSDIVQETQLEALRRMDEYIQDPQLPVRLWMRQIALDRLLMARRQHLIAEKRSLRREWTLPEESSVAIAQRLLTRLPSPSQAAAHAEIAGKVRSAVAQLADEDREIVLLQAFEGLSSTESAQVLGITPVAARKRFGRALLRLKRFLEPTLS